MGANGAQIAPATYYPNQAKTWGQFTPKVTLGYQLSDTLLYATFGQGREAVRTLERYLTANPNDVEASFMAVEWLYQLKASGAAAHSPADDLKLARRYAGVYTKAKGPQAAMLNQWMAALEGKKR